MNAGLLIGVVRARSALRAHDRWARRELVEYQARALRELRAFAGRQSPFYRELHRGLDDAPLDALPVVTKQMLMERFDDLVTDRDVHLADVERHVEHASATDTFRGRYHVVGTGGTTGRRGLFLYDRHEWQTVLASYARAYDWAGISPGATNRLRMAIVSSLNPSHQSAIVGATVASPFVPTLRLDAAQPMAELVGQLNAFRPQALVGYPSILRELAGEQAGGRLAISPRGVFAASEVLAADTRALIEAAFGARVTNVYAATETAGIASECARGLLHCYEDLVIVEIVDDDNRPVADGEYGAKLLVSVLFSRTQPLIRYELSDRVKTRGGECTDGLPYALLDSIEGRQEELLVIGGVSVHPNIFHAVMDRLPVTGWQVLEFDGALRVLVTGDERADPAAIRGQLSVALRDIAAQPAGVEVERVTAIPRTATGKAPLIRRASRPPPIAINTGR